MDKMTNWIDVKDRLPDEDMYYDWLLVAADFKGDNEPNPWTIASYTEKGWEFFVDKYYEETEKKILCPDFSDCFNKMNIKDIAYWQKLEPVPSRKTQEKENCKKVNGFIDFPFEIGNVVIENEKMKIISKDGSKEYIVEHSERHDFPWNVELYLKI